ncbi:hypothetical protein E4U27_005378 [Claviceps purpurea]|nr:hypothetical protein E4U27_005378 [Claviceps purpurea]
MDCKVLRSIAGGSTRRLGSTQDELGFEKSIVPNGGHGSGHVAVFSEVGLLGSSVVVGGFSADAVSR